MLKRQEGKKREKKTHTQLPGFELALLRQLLASSAGNLTKQLRKQNTRSVSSLNIMSRSRNPPSEKETLLTWLQIQIWVEGNCKVNRANIFCRKNWSRRERDLPEHLFVNGRLSCCSIGAACQAARLIKASRVFVAVRKRLIDNEPSWLFDCHRMSALKQRLRLKIDWRQKRVLFPV